MANVLVAGASQSEITPKDSQFLFGYPHIRRYSTGVHDPLFSSALYLSDGTTLTMFVGNDIIFVSKTVVARARRRIQQATGIPEQNIMITATHTHSGPHTVDYISNEGDPTVPKADEHYILFMEDQIVITAIRAFEAARPAKVGLAVADDTGVGTNRREPSGPADHQVPVFLATSENTGENIACMLVCSMHPTVLHEDSTLISADFPGMARKYLQENVLGRDCPVLHHTGPCGNQSPRHVTKANNFDEAARLGAILGKAVAKVIPEIKYETQVSLKCRRTLLDLPKRTLPTIAQAQEKLNAALSKLKDLRNADASAQELRTAECDWFGAEETLTLARASADRRLQEAYTSCLPAEIQTISIGTWNFVGWQGEIFTDYALEVKARCANTFVISMANGELQGYIVTEEAFNERGYEASNALFSHTSGIVLVDATLGLLKH